MAQTVFWSWQSDRDDRVTRQIVRESLILALAQIQGDAEIEDRVELDHDTRNVPGSPDIVASILEKIDGASVFVGDITPIAVSESGKHVANPNVLIELGYAKKAISPSQIITVWNTAFTASTPENLPFDLRGRRGPVSFDLPSGADTAAYRAARDVLVKEFTFRISACLEMLPKPTAAPVPWAPHMPDRPAMWVDADKPLPVNLNRGGAVRLLFADDVRCYARLIPTVFDRGPFDSGVYPPFIGNWGSWSVGTARQGMVSFSTSPPSEDLITVPGGLMWFRNTGEVWFVESGLKGEWEGKFFFHGDQAAQTWIEFVVRALRHSRKNGGSGPFNIKLGVAGMADLRWPVHNSFAAPPVALDDALEMEFAIDAVEPAAWVQHLNSAWSALRRNFSMKLPTPEELIDGFRQSAN